MPLTVVNSVVRVSEFTKTQSLLRRASLRSDHSNYGRRPFRKTNGLYASEREYRFASLFIRISSCLRTVKHMVLVRSAESDANELRLGAVNGGF